MEGVALDQKEADNEMRKKMILVEGVVLDQIVQRKEFNFVQAAIALAIVDRFAALRTFHICIFIIAQMSKNIQNSPQECATADWSVHKVLCKAKARKRKARIGKKLSEVD